FLLTLFAYVVYVRRAQLALEANDGIRMGKSESITEPSDTGPSSSFIMRHASLLLPYLLSLAFFACGLMSKPMLVTTPFVLLLIDFWPLGRFAAAKQKAKPASAKAVAFSLIWEKAPYFTLSAISCAITVIAQRRGGNIASLESVSVGLRIENALVAYVLYLKKALWPAGLACYY